MKKLKFTYWSSTAFITSKERIVDLYKQGQLNSIYTYNCFDEFYEDMIGRSFHLDSEICYFYFFISDKGEIEFSESFNSFQEFVRYYKLGKI